MEGVTETKLAQGSLWDEDDARSLNITARIVQRECTIPHSMIKNMMCLQRPVMPNRQKYE